MRRHRQGSGPIVIKRSHWMSPSHIDGDDVEDMCAHGNCTRRPWKLTRLCEQHHEQAEQDDLEHREAWNVDVEVDEIRGQR